MLLIITGCLSTTVRGMYGLKFIVACFRQRRNLGHMPVFSLDNVKAQSKLSSFNNIPVMRLSPELQIVYTASHWGLELRRAGGVLELIDIIYLLARAAATRSMELNYAL